MFEPESTYEELSPLAMESRRLGAKFPHLTDVEKAHHLKAFERLETTYALYRLK